MLRYVFWKPPNDGKLGGALCYIYVYVYAYFENILTTLSLLLVTPSSMLSLSVAKFVCKAMTPLNVRDLGLGYIHWVGSIIGVDYIFCLGYLWVRWLDTFGGGRLHILDLQSIRRRKCHVCGVCGRNGTPVSCIEFRCLVIPCFRTIWLIFVIRT